MIGSDTVGQKLMPAMLEDYAASLNADIDTTVLSEEDTYVRYFGVDGSEVGSVFINSTGSTEGFEGLAASAADFGMASRAVTNNEAAAIVRNGVLQGTDNETVIAMDSVAVATHPDNDGSWTRTNCSDLSGPDHKLVGGRRFRRAYYCGFS